MKELIIKIKWGGLGDHLFHSPIPRVAKLQGYDKVYIANESDFIWPETKKFIWESNPFVNGFKKQASDMYPAFGDVEEGMNILDKLVLWWGLKDDSIRFREPEVYYKPKIKEELKNAALFDSNFKTPVGHPSPNQVSKYFNNNNIVITHQMKPFYANNYIRTKNFVMSKSLEDFCDILFSCKKIYCYTTGTATLAAALGRSVTVLHNGKCLPMFHHSKLHKYEKLT
jgi:hypothetical protein